MDVPPLWPEQLPAAGAAIHTTSDINDQAWRADLLGRLLKNKNAHVNLIPLNPTPGSKWTASRPEDERAFVELLEGYGVPVTVRDTRGREIDGACGQLAASETTK